MQYVVVIVLMTMADWSALLQRYMDLNNRPVLPDSEDLSQRSYTASSLQHNI